MGHRPSTINPVKISHIAPYLTYKSNTSYLPMYAGCLHIFNGPHSFTQIFLNNVMRIKAIIMEFVSLGKFVESVLEWERPLVTLVVFVAFVTLAYYFQPYMFPIGLLLVFLKNYIVMGYQACI